MISIVVCTYNRAESLDRVLQSLAEQTVPIAYEVIVVDNGSSDHTRQVLGNWLVSGKLALQCIVEKQPGLSNARNAAIRAAKSDIIAFVDDDVILYQDWLKHVADSFERYPEVDCVGGPSDAEWETVPPEWLTQELAGMVAPGWFGSGAKLLTGRAYPPGLNMAFRRSAFDRIGFFNPNLGRIGSSLLGCEEVDLVERLRSRGGKVLYNPEMRVRHSVPTQRMSQDYFLNRRRGDGRSIAIWEYIRGGAGLLFWKAVLRAFVAVPRDMIAWGCLTMIRDADRRFTYTCRLAKNVAYLRQAISIILPSSRSRPRPETG